MPKNEVEDYLKSKRWKYRLQKGSEPSRHQFVVTPCPYCKTDKEKFYININTGQFICHRGQCGREGNLYKLKKDQGDIAPIKPVLSSKPLPKAAYSKVRNRIIRYHKNLLNLDPNSKIRKFILQKWGYDEFVIKKFKLGLQRSANGTKWVVIPYIEGKKIINAKFRSLPPADKTFKRIAGMESALFNINNLDTTLKYINFTEGESDAITLDRMGFKNVLGTSVGARGFKPEWKDLFDQFETINLFYDNDIAGEEGALKMAKRIGMEKCRRVMIPSDSPDITDVTDYVLIGGADRDDVVDILKSARMFDVEDVLSMSNVLETMETDLYMNKTLDDAGLKTPWDKVNKLLGSFVAGDLIILSGQAKIGKSTLALNLLTSYAMNNIPSLYYCLEMRPERIMAKTISSLRLVGRKEITVDDIIYCRTVYGNKPLYFAHSYKFTTEQVFDTMREAIKRYGIEFMAFDHLHFLCRSISNVSAEVGNVVREFKLLAEELGIPIMIIAQTRKVQGRERV